MATAPSPNDLTRQQLDELDALLQKMLTVPISVDTPLPAASLPAMAQPPLPPSWRIDPPATAPVPSATMPPPSTGPALSLADFALDNTPVPAPKTAKPVPAPPPAPVAKVSPPPAPTPKPVVSPPPAPAAKVAPAPSPPKPVVVPPLPKPVPVPTAVAPVPAAPPVPLLMLPFVALNGLFDSTCGMFGPPGRLFRSGLFKQLYGFAGLGLVAYTALHIAQIQGWLTLPVALPWPK